MELWEQILLGAAAILFLFWVGPGLKPMLQKSQEAEKDWKGVLIPIVIVILFVFLLIKMV